MFRSGSGGRGAFKPPSFLQRTDSGGGATAGSSTSSTSSTSILGGSASSSRSLGAARTALRTGDEGSSSHNDGGGPSNGEGPGGRLLSASSAYRVPTSSYEGDGDGETSVNTAQSYRSYNKHPATPRAGPSFAAGRAGPTAGSPGSNGTEAGDEHYMCMWRKPQGRKHKTWDGDAVLIVNRGRGTVKLKCQETGRE